MSGIVDASGEEIQSTEKVKAYKLYLTEKEMQNLANGLTAFFNVMANENRQISPEQTLVLIGCLKKMKDAIAGNDYKIVQETI